MVGIEGLRKQFRSGKGEVRAVRGITLYVPEGTFHVLLGPSGCGKTTTLRCIAGLELPDEGTIRISDRIVYSSNERVVVPPENRPVAMVFQSYALWPHMDVLGNIVFPLRYGRWTLPKREAYARAESAIALLKLDPVARRQVTSLSGGQQQRVALARALSLQPQVLLLDEPLSNLDAKLRAELRVELKQLIRKLSITAVYVTHDQSEALSMGDRITVMEDGIIVQEGKPQEIYDQPKALFTARFLGDTNFIPGVLTALDESGVGVVSSPLGNLTAQFPSQLPLQSRVVVGIRVEEVRLSSQEPDSLYPGVVRDRFYYGNFFVYLLEIGEQTLRAQVLPSTRFEINQGITVRLPPEKCFGFPAMAV